MAKFDDFADGTAFIYLFPEDFKSEYRFEQYANFMGQDADRAIQIPIDSRRAKRYRDDQKRFYGGVNDGNADK